MNCIFVSCYPTKSHFFAILDVLYIIKKALPSVQITIVSAIHLKQDVIENGFGFIALEAPLFGVGYENILFRKSDLFNNYLDNLISRHSMQLFKLRQKAYNEILKKNRPDIFLVDIMLSNDIIILYQHVKKHRIKFAFFQTTFPFYPRKYLTPPNYFLSKKITPGQIHIETVWMFFLLKRYIRRLIQMFIFIGRDNYSIVKWAFRFNNLPIKYSCFQSLAFVVGFRNIQELVIAPLELEPFQKNEFNLCNYFLPSRVNRTYSVSAQIKEKLDHYKSNKIVYCGFGTVQMNRHKEKRIRLLLHGIYEFSKQYKNYIFFISLHNFDKIINVRHIPERIEFYNTLPQLHLLSKSTLFITHGGLNSIKESILCEVPMLVFPIDTHYDQPSNAQRIERLKIGLHIPKSKLNKIGYFISKVSCDLDFKKNIKEIKSQITEKYTDFDIINYFSNLRSLD